ncbi:hypothetical protein JL721_9880 [Aureococcus anophagefferens]|nr:hypothetical protein JL721_9880 [Aureococcus anophagefferens]
MRQRRSRCSIQSCMLGMILATICFVVFAHFHALKPVALPVAAPAPAKPPPMRPEKKAITGFKPPPARPQQPPPPPPARPERATKLKPGEPEVHVVFSTDCSGYQHWQSIALWYSSRMAGQRGPVTRIASGCDEQQQRAIAREWRDIDDTGEFRAHFAPAGELRGNYNSCSGRSRRRALASTPADAKFLYDASDVPRVIGDGARDLAGLAPVVAPGRPVAQEYGIGGAWGDAGKPDARPSWRAFDRARVCGADGACTRTTERDAAARYSVGPPYLVHSRDATALAKAWLDAVPAVHAQYPYLLAEMYAYSMAAANLSLPHGQVHHLMVSNTGAGGEGWNWVDGAADAVGAKRATVRAAYFLCNVLPRLNAALLAYKRDVRLRASRRGTSRASG